MRSLGQLLRYHRHLEVDCAGWLHRVLLEEVRDHAYEHIDSLRTIDVRTIVGRALLQSDRRRWEDGDKLDPISLCGGIEKSGYEDRLSSDIASADLSNLPLPDHRHRFETCQCSSGVRNPPKPSPGRTRRLMRR